MNRKSKLKICNLTLLILYLPTLITSLHMEVTGGASAAWTWSHIAVCTAFMVMIIIHVYLHIKWSAWDKRLIGRRRGVVRWMSVFGALVILSSIIVMAHWAATQTHSTIGGIHGKIGFIFLLIILIHIIRHRTYYLRK